MQVVKGTPNYGSFTEGTEAAAPIAKQDHAVRLPPALQRELKSALDETDQVLGISADELFAELFGNLGWDASFDYKAERTRRE